MRSVTAGRAPRRASGTAPRDRSRSPSLLAGRTERGPRPRLRGADPGQEQPFIAGSHPHGARRVRQRCPEPHPRPPARPPRCAWSPAARPRCRSCCCCSPPVSAASREPRRGWGLGRTGQPSERRGEGAPSLPSSGRPAARAPGAARRAARPALRSRGHGAAALEVPLLDLP